MNNMYIIFFFAEDNTNVLTLRTIDEDRSQLEELIVEEDLKVPPCQSPALLEGSSLAGSVSLIAFLLMKEHEKCNIKNTY